MRIPKSRRELEEIELQRMQRAKEAAERAEEHRRRGGGPIFYTGELGMKAFDEALNEAMRKYITEKF